MSFEGPLSQIRLDAETTRRHRLEPAMADRPGFVRALTLWHPETRGLLTLLVCTSLDSLESLRRAAASTPLLRTEDPALLPGPDRVELYTVVPPPRYPSVHSTHGSEPADKTLPLPVDSA